MGIYSQIQMERLISRHNQLAIKKANEGCEFSSALIKAIERYRIMPDDSKVINDLQDILRLWLEHYNF